MRGVGDPFFQPACGGVWLTRVVCALRCARRPMPAKAQTEPQRLEEEKVVISTLNEVMAGLGLQPCTPTLSHADIAANEVSAASMTGQEGWNKREHLHR